MTAEGSVYQRKDERWVAQYTDAKGKVRYLYRKSEATSSPTRLCSASIVLLLEGERSRLTSEEVVVRLAHAEDEEASIEVPTDIIVVSLKENRIAQVMYSALFLRER